MKQNECIEDLAPSVIVRAALFPLHTLISLADEDLVSNIANECTQSTSAFEQLYEASIQKQRRILAKATIEAPQFLRALCLTNDDLSRTISIRDAFPPERNKRARRLEKTLYNYLARGVWRTEPCDLWAGIALGRWGEKSSLEFKSTRYALSPDLRPYQFIVQKLALTSIYVDSGIYKLNPTLEFDELLQCWRYTVRVFDSIITRKRPSSSGIDTLLRALAEMEPANLTEIAVGLRRTGFLDPALENILVAFQSIGLLVGGLAFPRTFATAWDALMDIPPRLNRPHARQWRIAVIRLRRICRRIERTMETISLMELHNTLDEVRSIPIELAKSLEVEAPVLPRSVLRCDIGLPFSLIFGPDVKAGIMKAVAEYDLFERFSGVDAAARVAHRTIVLREPIVETNCQQVLTQESAWRAAGADSLVGQRLQCWSLWLKADSPINLLEFSVDGLEVKPAPIGGLIMRPSLNGYEITGSTTEIVATYGRYAHVWYGLTNRDRHRFKDHPLHEWYREMLVKVARNAGIEIVEYVGPCEAIPNGLARPYFDFPMWDRWGTTSSYKADQFYATIPRRASIPLVFASDFNQPISLTCFSPVNLGYSELSLERLLLSSFREIPAWLSSGIPMECELTMKEPSPPLTLPSGNCVRLRRTWIHGTTLTEFVTASRPRRFLLWQALARKFSWPKVLLVARDGKRPLLVVRDSPLALEAALHGISESVKFISIDEPDDHTWLFDDKGNGFAAEIIVPFVRLRHAWSEMDTSQFGSSSTS
jgi:hypothetical protein